MHGTYATVDKVATHSVNDVPINRCFNENVHITNLNFSPISTSVAMAMKNMQHVLLIPLPVY